MKVLTAFGLALCYASIAHAQTVQWTQILDSSQEDRGRGVSADGMGNVYVTGWTTGVFGSDAFVSKYDSSGAHQWTRQLGADFGSDSHSVSADGMGNIYISGGIGDSPFEPADFTGVDAFVSKYDSDGTFLWTRKLATIYTERNNAVSADSLGNIFVAGFTWGNLDGLSVADADGDAFLAKYDADGSLAWTRQFGTSHADIARGVSADGSGNVYVSGWTDGNLADGAIGPSDGFVRKYDSSGMLVWTRQLGTLFEDQSTGISADGMGNVYVTGYTEGDLEGTNAGIADAYLVKYNADGILQWKRQLGSEKVDLAESVSADDLGNIFITGYTRSDLAGPNAGQYDVFVSMYDADGILQWTRQLGNSENDQSYSVSADGLGSAYIAGDTNGTLTEFTPFEPNVFLVKLSAVPEPSSLSLIGMGGIVLVLCQISRRQTSKSSSCVFCDAAFAEI